MGDVYVNIGTGRRAVWIRLVAVDRFLSPAKFIMLYSLFFGIIVFPLLSEPKPLVFSFKRSYLSSEKSVSTSFRIKSPFCRRHLFVSMVVHFFFYNMKLDYARSPKVYVQKQPYESRVFTTTTFKVSSAFKRRLISFEPFQI